MLLADSSTDSEAIVHAKSEALPSPTSTCGSQSTDSCPPNASISTVTARVSDKDESGSDEDQPASDEDGPASGEDPSVSDDDSQPSPASAPEVWCVMIP